MEEEFYKSKKWNLFHDFSMMEVMMGFGSMIACVDDNINL